MSNARHLSERQLTQALNGVPTYLGSIVSADSSTPKDNGNTAVPFNNSGDALKKKLLLLQPDVGGTLNFIVASAVAVPAAAASLTIGAGERVNLTLDNTNGYLTWRAEAAAQSTLKVFEMS